MSLKIVVICIFFNEFVFQLASTVAIFTGEESLGDVRDTSPISRQDNIRLDDYSLYKTN